MIRRAKVIWRLFFGADSFVLGTTGRWAPYPRDVATNSSPSPVTVTGASSAEM